MTKGLPENIKPGAIPLVDQKNAPFQIEKKRKMSSKSFKIHKLL